MKHDEAVWNDLERIRNESPLIHNITNHVVMGYNANALLALGASPVMAHASEEIDEIVSISQALVLNIGTLDSQWILSMRQAALAAKDKNIPIVLDPVGAGASQLRINTAQDLIDLARPAVIRGNASEIMALAGTGASARGVDSQHDSSAALEYARLLSRRCECVVSVSGATDYIVWNDEFYSVHNGHHNMTRVTGMGCAATALTAAFCAVNKDFHEAAAHAMALMGVTGELADTISEGPGSLQINFLDWLFRIRAHDLRQRLRMERN